MKATILVGCSGSGKSTYAKSLDGIIIERDEVREMILSQKGIGNKCPSEEYLNIPVPQNKIRENIWSYWKFNWEPEVTKIIDADIARAAKNQYDIIISDTNLNPVRRSLLASKLEELGYDVSIEVVGKELTLPELWKRDLNRKNSVGHEVIAKQYEQFRREFPLHQLTPVTTNERAIIFDIDGTLATMRNRSPFEWEKVGYDEPNMILFYAMKAYYEQGYKIIILSGRDSVCINETIQWLDDVIFENPTMKISSENVMCTEYIYYDLYMRKEGDMRSDVIVKQELFFTHIDGKYTVDAVFDDRPKVCHLWRELGFRVYACANPHIDF